MDDWRLDATYTDVLVCSNREFSCPVIDIMEFIGIERVKMKFWERAICLFTRRYYWKIPPNFEMPKVSLMSHDWINWALQKLNEDSMKVYRTSLYKVTKTNLSSWRSPEHEIATLRAPATQKSTALLFAVRILSGKY